MSLGTRYTSGRSAIDNARRKYGPSSFTYEILERVECDTLESRSALLNEREVYWISYYDTYKHGYNSTTGGLGSSGFKQPRHVVEMLHNRRASEESSEFPVALLSSLILYRLGTIIPSSFTHILLLQTCRSLRGCLSAVR